jgi:dTDP-4-dehydrorhamnose reductase
MRLLVFGYSGQVARELERRRPDGVDLVRLARDDADLTDPRSCARQVAAHPADAVVIAAAFTGVDTAEGHEAEAERVNAQAPAAIAEACAAAGRPLIHLSTDYVFDGSGDRPWRPDDAPAPLGAYGRTKRAGEEAVLAADPDAVVLRTSWVFSVHGGNFVKTMLRLGRERDALRVVDDQFGGPTAAADIADAVYRILWARIAGEGAPGLHHFAGAPAVSWADFARTIFEQAGLEVAVASIPTSEYPTPAARPLNSRLDCTSTREAFGIDAPDWRQALRAVIDELENAA